MALELLALLLLFLVLLLEIFDVRKCVSHLIVLQVGDFSKNQVRLDSF